MVSGNSVSFGLIHREFYSHIALKSKQSGLSWFIACTYLSNFSETRNVFLENKKQVFNSPDKMNTP